MKVDVVSEHIKYSITFDELCKVLKIPSTKEIDFLDMTIDTNKELIILEQVEPPYVLRPKGEK